MADTNPPDNRPPMPSGAFPFAPKSGVQPRSLSSAANPVPPPPASAPGAPLPSAVYPSQAPGYGGTAGPPPSLPPSSFGAPPSAAPSQPIIFQEEVVDTAEDRKRRVIAIVGGLVVVAGIIASVTWTVTAERRKQKALDAKRDSAGNIPSMMLLLSYAQTFQRMRILAIANGQYFEQSGVWAAKFSELLSQGADTSMMRDKWGEPFLFRGSEIVTKGQDMQLGTKDDAWLDCATFSIGGYDPSSETSPVTLLPGASGDRLRSILRESEAMRRDAAQFDRARMESMMQELESMGGDGGGSDSSESSTPVIESAPTDDPTIDSREGSESSEEP